MILLAGMGMATTLWLSAAKNSDPWGPTVGSHLHGVVPSEGAVFLSGHSGTRVLDDDMGSQGEAIALPTEFHPLVWAPGTAGAIYAVSSGGQLLTVGPSRDTKLRPLGDPITSLTAFGARDNAMFAVDEAGRVFYSQDAGRTFVARSPRRALAGAISISGTDPRTALALDESGRCLETRNGGRAWSACRRMPGTEVLIANPADWSHLALLADGAVHQSFDHGATWSPTESPPDITDLAFDSDGELFAAAVFENQGIVFRRSDDGWTAVP